MARGISRRALAKQLKVSVNAVQKAVAAKRIPVLPDGSIDPKAAKAAWASRTDPVRSRVKAPARKRRKAAPAVKTVEEAREAVALIRRVLREEGVSADGAMDLVLIRTAELILRAREREQKLAERRKQLVEIAPVCEQVTRAFVGLRQSWQQFPARHAAIIAAEVGCDAGMLDVALGKAIANELTQLSAPVVRG